MKNLTTFELSTISGGSTTTTWSCGYLLNDNTHLVFQAYLNCNTQFDSCRNNPMPIAMDPNNFLTLIKSADVNDKKYYQLAQCVDDQAQCFRNALLTYCRLA